MRLHPPPHLQQVSDITQIGSLGLVLYLNGKQRWSDVKELPNGPFIELRGDATPIFTFGNHYEAFDSPELP